jgi:hypothetical protein
MALRFRRTFRVLPGMKLSLSRSGVSASFGIRGLGLTVGPRGVYGNVGAPGTGLSYRTRLDSGALRGSGAVGAGGAGARVSGSRRCRRQGERRRPATCNA